MKTQNPIISKIGTQVEKRGPRACGWFARGHITTFRSSNRFTRPSYCGGATVRKVSLAFVVPEISLPVMVTCAIGRYRPPS